MIAEEGRDADGLLWLTQFCFFFISEKKKCEKKRKQGNLLPFLSFFCYFSLILFFF